MMCTSCHCCRCLPPAKTFRIILQILYHKVLLPHWSRVSIGSLVYTWWSYIQVYTHMYFKIVRTCFAPLVISESLQRNLVVALNHVLNHHLCRPFRLLSKLLVSLSSANTITHNATSIPLIRDSTWGWWFDWSLWGNLWHHSTLGLSFCSRLLCGHTLNGVAKWSTMPALYFLDQSPCPSGE